MRPVTLHSVPTSGVAAPSIPALALLGGAKTVNCQLISPAWPRFSPTVIDAVAQLLRTGRASTTQEGDPTREAELAFASWVGVRHALAVSSGTAALHCALAATGVAPGDEVITSPYSWGATTACIIQHGAIPVFADVEAETGLLDPTTVERLITPRTRAIMVVHIYGQPANMDGLRGIADRHGLKLLEDCSQAHGAKHRGRRVGSLGDASGFSCMSGKLLSTTEMGMFVTNDRKAYERAVLFCQHNRRVTCPVTERGGGIGPELLPLADSLGYNYRTTDINALLLLDQLPHLDAWNAARQANRDHLATLIGDLPFLRVARCPAHVEPVYHMINLRYDETLAGGVTRETFSRAIGAEGVWSTAYVRAPMGTWPRLQPGQCDSALAPWLRTIAAAGRSYRAEDTPVCALLCAKQSFQMNFNGLTEAEPELIGQVGQAICKVAANLGDLLKWQRSNDPSATR